MIQHTRHSKVMDLKPLDNLGNVRKWTIQNKTAKYNLYELPCSKQHIWEWAERLRSVGFIMIGDKKHIVLHRPYENKPL